MAVDFKPTQAWARECTVCGERVAEATNSWVAHAEHHVRVGDSGRCLTHNCLRCAAGVCHDHDTCWRDIPTN